MSFLNIEAIAYIDFLLALLFFAIALIYSAVGLGGGSVYTALMVVIGVNVATVPAISLSLNLLVSTLGSYNFLRNRHGKLRIILPFLVSAIPFSYLGGWLNLSKEVFLWVLLVSLIVVVMRIYFWRTISFDINLNQRQKIIVSLIIGSILGLVAGIAGIGGGIYLVPLITILKLGTEKQAAAAGAIFVWAVSFSGLVSRLQYNAINLVDYKSIIIAVMMGGFLGSYLGAGKFSPEVIEKILGIVVLIAIVFLVRNLLF